MSRVSKRQGTKSAWRRWHRGFEPGKKSSDVPYGAKAVRNYKANS